MRSIHDWLDEYGRSHTHGTNRVLHFICVPAIVFSVFCALLALPGTRWINALSATIVIVLLYYLRLSWRLALGAGVVFAVFGWAAVQLAAWSGDGFLWITAGIFIVAWIGQFIGHAVEGARPSFIKDLEFLLIGPLWELAFFYRLMGWRISAPFSTPSPGQNPGRRG